MKRYYYIGAAAAAALLIGGIGAGLWLLAGRPAPRKPEPGTVIESETVEEEHTAQEREPLPGKDGPKSGAEGEIPDGAGLTAGLWGSRVWAQFGIGKAEEEPEAAGQEEADGRKTADKSGERYCLVAENGFLLVFAENRSSVCLDTHMPLTEFPLSEQERLLDGIWFDSMIEVFNYLESFTS